MILVFSSHQDPPLTIVHVICLHRGVFLFFVLVPSILSGLYYHSLLYLYESNMPVSLDIFDIPSRDTFSKSDLNCVFSHILSHLYLNKILWKFVTFVYTQPYSCLFLYIMYKLTT